MQDGGLIKKIKQFDEVLNYQAKCLCKYMKMFEVLLLFIRASREENWELHLASLELMIPYFFSHDQLNYARFTPLYIATMMGLKENDEVGWKYLKDNFSINKTGIPIRSCSSTKQQATQSKWRSSWLNTESYSSAQILPYILESCAFMFPIFEEFWNNIQIYKTQTLSAGRLSK